MKNKGANEGTNTGSGKGDKEWEQGKSRGGGCRKPREVKE